MKAIGLTEFGGAARSLREKVVLLETVRGRVRRALIIVSVLVVVVGLPVGVDLTSVQPPAAIVKAVLDSGPLVKPGPDYAAVSAQVSVVHDIAIIVPDAPDAVIDVYSLGNSRRRSAR